VTIRLRLSILSVLPELPCFNDVRITLYSEVKSDRGRLRSREICAAKHPAGSLDTEDNRHLAEIIQILFSDKEICTRTDERDLLQSGYLSLRPVRLLRRVRSRRHLHDVEVYRPSDLLYDGSH